VAFSRCSRATSAASKLTGCGTGPGGRGAREVAPFARRCRHVANWEVYSLERRSTVPRRGSPFG
jgi:hypothetical protein